MSSADQKSPVLIVTVRGSTEPASGSRLLTPMDHAISHRYAGEVQVHSLPYPATFESFTATYPARIDLEQSPTIGVHNLVSLLNNEAASRPERRTVLLGWSQGAQVITDALVHPAARYPGTDAPDLHPTAVDQIAAIALFGNPTFTAGEPHNAGEPAPGVSGVIPRQPGMLRRTWRQSATTAHQAISLHKTRQDQTLKDTLRTSTTACPTTQPNSSSAACRRQPEIRHPDATLAHINHR